MFKPPECNSEIPQIKGAFAIKEEDDIVNIQKGIFVHQKVKQK